MTHPDTILGRCCTAYEERLVALGYDEELHLCLAAVLDHLAGEIQALQQQNQRLTVAELAQVLIREAAAVEPEPEEPPETWASHPSLTPEQRNPSLR